MNTQNTHEDKGSYVAVCCGPCSGWRAAFWGIVLVALGGLGLLSLFVPLPPSLGRYIFPVLLVLWGGFILFNWRRTRA